MTTKYDYDDHTWAEIDHMARKAMPSNSRLHRATLPEDFNGVDVHYTVNGNVPLALRARFDRPAYAADIDVTFRTTEPAKMGAGTYAPLMLFVWLTGGFAKAGKLIDVYRLFHNADPPLDERPAHPNGDGTSWFGVEIAELHGTRSLLRQGDRDDWAASALGGNERTKWLLAHWVNPQ